MSRARRLPPHLAPLSILCPICHGTGLDSAQAFAHIHARVALDDATREAAVRCRGCEGRGRQPVAADAGFPRRR